MEILDYKQLGLKLKYCDSRIGNTGSCASVAIYKVKLCSRSHETEILNTENSCRCEKHKDTGTTGKKVYEKTPFDQSSDHAKVNEYLKSLIGKTIKSRFHTARELQVKYLKENGGVMCFQPITKKWKYVFYNQIEAVL